VSIDKITDIHPGRFRDTVTNCFQLLACRTHSAAKTGDFIFDQLFRNGGFVDLNLTLLQPVDFANGNAA
jgi:hypothetical protein